MRLNKTTQYGLLFALYLVGAGRASTASAAEGLHIPVAFLDQIARRLRLAGVVRSVRGSAGGYELVGEPTVGNVIQALGERSLVSIQDIELNLKSASPERRAFANFMDSAQHWIDTPLDRPIRELVLDLAQAEGAMLDQTPTTSVQ